MAFRTWAQTLGIAAGAAFLAAAGQLGVGSGLGLLRWDGDFADGAAWHTQVGWLAFLTALATVAGAAVGRWAPAGFAGTSTAEREQRWARAALCLAAAVGAAVFIPIGTRPARGVHIPVTGTASAAAGMAMLLGLVLGVAVGYAVLSVPAVGGNVVTFAIWLWLAALASALWSLRQHGTVAGAPVTRSAARLGLIPPAGSVTAGVLLLGIPAAIGLVAALVSRFGGGGRWAVAGSGAAGPLLVAGAYLIGGPGGGSHTVAYWCSVGGVATGVAASAFVALARRTGPGQAGALASPVNRWDGPEGSAGDGSAGARHAAADSPAPLDSASASPWPDDSASASGWPEDSAASRWPEDSAAASRWPEDSGSASRWPEGSAGTTSWPEEPASASRWPEETSATPGWPDDSPANSSAPSWPASSSTATSWPESSANASTNWPESSATASTWSASASIASSRPESSSPSGASSSSVGWSSSDAARRWLDGGSAGLPVSSDRLDADTDSFAAPVPVSSVDEVDRAASEASDRAVAALWGDTGAQPIDTGSTGGHGYREPEPAAATAGSRHRPTFFESAPAPEVPAAPTSRGRPGGLFDADPIDDDELVVPRGRHAGGRDGLAELAGGGPVVAEPGAVAPTSPARGGSPEAEVEAEVEVEAGDAPEAEPVAEAVPEPVAEKAPTGRLGRRGKRAKEAQQPPEIHAKDTEYVDWFKDLRGSGRS